MAALIILGIVLFLGLIFVVMVISTHNDIIANENRAKRAWSNVVSQVVRKDKVIPALMDAVKEYKEFEAGTFAKVTELRSSIAKLSKDAINVVELAKVETMSKDIFSALSGMRVTVEAYPDLKASGLYGKYMKELSEVQKEITSALEVYNEGVERFNNSIEQFPASVVNSMWNKEVPLDIFTDSSVNAEFDYKPNFS